MSRTPWKNNSGNSESKPAAAPAKSAANTNNSGGQTKGKNITLLDFREVETKAGLKAKIQFAKGVEILYYGEKVDLGEYNSAFLKNREEMDESLGFLVEKEYMTAEEADEKAEFYDSKRITAQLVVKI